MKSRGRRLLVPEDREGKPDLIYKRREIPAADGQDWKEVDARILSALQPVAERFESLERELTARILRVKSEQMILRVDMKAITARIPLLDALLKTGRSRR
jgi:hypothetical protein